MRNRLLSFIGLLLLAGCSTPQHEDAWRYQAAAATKAYGEHFLKDETVLIKSNYSHAERSAKQSSDLLPLARLYLSRCALNRAVLVDDPCNEFAQTLAVYDDPELGAYYAMLTNTLTPDAVDDLPYRYRRFAKAYLTDDVPAIHNALEGITPLRSRMVAASLVRDRLSEKEIEAIIDDASHLGYRRAVIAWMEYLRDVTADPHKRAQLQRKLELLTQ